MTPRQKQLLPMLLASIAALPAPLLLRSQTHTRRPPVDRLQLPTRIAHHTLPMHVPPPPAERPAPRVRPAPSRPAPRKIPSRRWSLRLVRRPGETRLVACAGPQPGAGPLRLYFGDLEIARAPHAAATTTLLRARAPQLLPPGEYVLRDGHGTRLARRRVGSDVYQRLVRTRYQRALEHIAGLLRKRQPTAARAALRRLDARYRLPPLPERRAALVDWCHTGTPDSYRLMMAGAPQ